MSNLNIWKQFSRPPEWALRTIKAGRLKNMTDVSPLWRIMAMTEVFGPCGIGWKYEVANKWTEKVDDGQVMVFADVNVSIKDQNGQWSEPIPGTGGNKLVTMESRGLHASDEGYKMAITDALSTAMKTLGVGADIYAGLWDGSKYIGATVEAEPEYITEEQQKWVRDQLAEIDADIEKFFKWLKCQAFAEIPTDKMPAIKGMIEKKKKEAANATDK